MTATASTTSRAGPVAVPLRASTDRPAGGASLRLGLLTPHDVTDPTAFSGTAYHAARALAEAAGVELRVIAAPPRGRLARLTRRRGRDAQPVRADFEGLDAVVGLVATRLAHHVPSGVPFLHVTDATPTFLRDVYGWEIPVLADAAEHRVAKGAARVVYSSQAMAALAPRDLALPDLRAAVLPFGVNFATLPSQPPVKGDPARPRLLFVGKDWVRKGGETVIAAFELLRAAGIDARLDIVGPCPKPAARLDGVTAHGFLDRRRPRHARRLAGLYARAHVLVLPTRGDCTPMVLAEAMAHGTPPLATETGGTAEVIGGSGAGRVLPPGAAASDWAEAIREMTRDAATCAMLSDAAFDRAARQLTWSAWAAGIAGLARNAARGGRPASRAPVALAV